MVLYTILYFIYNFITIITQIVFCSIVVFLNLPLNNSSLDQEFAQEHTHTLASFFFSFDNVLFVFLLNTIHHTHAHIQRLSVQMYRVLRLKNTYGTTAPRTFCECIVVWG